MYILHEIQITLIKMQYIVISEGEGVSWYNSFELAIAHSWTVHNYACNCVRIPQSISIINSYRAGRSEAYHLDPASRLQYMVCIVRQMIRPDMLQSTDCASEPSKAFQVHTVR